MATQSATDANKIPFRDSPPPCGPATLSRPNSLSAFPAAPSSPPEAIAAEWQLISDGLADPALFPAVDWRKAENSGSLDKALSDKGVQALIAIFTAAHLTPDSVGYHPGTCAVSFTIALPVLPPPLRKDTLTPIGAILAT